MSNFKAGDIVQLKSGGPNMTVDWVSNEEGVETASCSWFDEKNKRQFERFLVTSLVAVSDNGPRGL